MKQARNSAKQYLPPAPEDLKTRLDAMRWSFSRVRAYADCPHRFLRSYLCGKPEKETNAFAQWGDLMHKLLAENAVGKLPTDKLATAYKRRFKVGVTEDFPPSFDGTDMKKRYFNDGLGYFFYYTGIPGEYDMLGAEIKAEFKVSKYDFIGYIDLLLRKRDSGEIIIVDHKSKNGFKSKKEQAEYAKQLYLYAKWVREHYGQFPSLLVFNLLRKNTLVEIPFDETTYEQTLDWFATTIDSIYDELTFRTRLENNAIRRGLDAKYSTPDYFCNHICDFRNDCIALRGDEDVN